MKLDGALKVWTLCADGEPRGGLQRSDAQLVAELRTWGVSRASAYRWVSDWHALAGDIDPNGVSARFLRTLVLRRASVLLE